MAARTGRRFPSKPIILGGLQLAASISTAATVNPPQTVHVIQAQYPARAHQGRDADVMLPQRQAAAASVQAAPRQPILVQARTPNRRQRTGAVIAPRVVSVTVLPRVQVVDPVASRKRPRPSSVILPQRQALEAFTTAVFVGPPKTITIIEARTPRAQRRSVVTLPQLQARAAATQAAPFVGPPKTVFVVQAQPPPRRRARGAVIAPRIFSVTVIPKTVTVGQAAFRRRTPPKTGRVIVPRPVVVTTTPRITIVDQAAFQKRRQRPGRIILPGRNYGLGTTPTSPIVVTEFLGYVTDPSDVGIPNTLLSSGQITVDSSGIPGILGDTGYTTSVYAPNDVCVLGYSNQTSPTDIPTLEAAIGRRFTGLRQNQQYTVTSISTAITEYDAGRTTSYRSIQFNTAPGGWAAAATGTFDTQLTTLCNNIIAAGRWTAQNPFWLCLHHEATTSGGVFGSPGFSAADHIAMWQHCVPVMRATGAPIKFAYVGWDRMFVGANGIGPPTPGESFDDLDPGVAYYDRIGSDPYNQPDSPGVLRYSTNARVLLEPIRQAAIARNMDWVMGEMGCQDGATQADHDAKAAWLDSLRVYVDGLGTIGPGVCRFIMTTQETPSQYNWDSSSTALDAGKRFGFDSYYS